MKSLAQWAAVALMIVGFDRYIKQGDQLGSCLTFSIVPYLLLTVGGNKAKEGK